MSEPTLIRRLKRKKVVAFGLIAVAVLIGIGDLIGAFEKIGHFFSGRSLHKAVSVNSYFLGALASNPELAASLGSAKTAAITDDDVQIQPYGSGFLFWSYRHENDIRICWFEGNRWERRKDNATSSMADTKHFLSTLGDERKRYFLETGSFLRVWRRESLGNTLGWPEANQLRLRPCLEQEFSGGLLVGYVPWWDRTALRFSTLADGQPDDGKGRVLAFLGSDSGFWQLLIPHMSG